MEKISWKYRVKNEFINHGEKKHPNWTGHILCRDFLLRNILMEERQKVLQKGRDKDEEDIGS